CSPMKRSSYRCVCSLVTLTTYPGPSASALLGSPPASLERVAPEFTKQSWMPAAAGPRESGGQHDVTPAQAGVQSTACPVTLVNATANGSRCSLGLVPTRTRCPAMALARLCRRRAQPFLLMFPFD